MSGVSRDIDVSASDAERRGRHKRLARRVNMAVTVVMMVVAVVLMSWPWVMQQITASGMLNEVTHAESAVGALSDEAREEYLSQAAAYDAIIARDDGVEVDDAPDVGTVWQYSKQLTYQHDPMMSWVDIPSIGVSLPIYHGTTEDTLMNGVGHLEGTSLPVGGASTHCVLTAHSGMAGATMFDDIRMLGDGDLVLLHTMDETLAYKVTGSEVVLPDEMDSLKVEAGRDMLTLVTCTPYGVNDHRLLVHCKRTEYDEQAADEERSPVRRHYGVRDVAFFVASGVTVVLAVVLFARHVARRRRRRRAAGTADGGHDATHGAAHGADGGRHAGTGATGNGRDPARGAERRPDGAGRHGRIAVARDASGAGEGVREPRSGHVTGRSSAVGVGRRPRRVSVTRDGRDAPGPGDGGARGDGTSAP